MNRMENCMWSVFCEEIKDGVCRHKSFNSIEWPKRKYDFEHGWKRNVLSFVSKKKREDHWKFQIKPMRGGALPNMHDLTLSHQFILTFNETKFFHMNHFDVAATLPSLFVSCVDGFFYNENTKTRYDCDLPAFIEKISHFHRCVAWCFFSPCYSMLWHNIDARTKHSFEQCKRCLLKLDRKKEEMEERHFFLLSRALHNKSSVILCILFSDQLTQLSDSKK